MKKNIFIICFIIVGCNSSLKYLNKFDGLNGQPKKVESTTYRIEYSDTVPTEKMAYKDIEFYDSKGRKIKTLTYKSDGSPSSGGNYYSYDNSGHLIKSIMYNRDSTINVENYFIYDDYGNEVESIYISGHRKFTTKKIYDKKNKAVKIIAKNNDGSFKENAIQKYDNEWNEIELISYDSTGIQNTRIEFLHDKKGNEIQSKWFNSENELYEYYNTTYNLKNDRVRIKKYRINKGKPKLIDDTKFEYDYDEKGNWIQKIIIYNGKTTWIKKNKYKYVW